MADGCSAREYLDCMDREGIDAVVLYPSIGLFVPFQPDAVAAGVRGRVPRVQRVDGRVPRHRSRAAERASRSYPPRTCELAAAEAAHAAALGLPGVMVRPEPALRPRPRRPRLRPALRRARGAGTDAVGPRGARRPRSDDRAGAVRDVRHAARDEPPDGADGGDGEPGAARCAGAPPGAAGGVPRVGHRMAPVLAGPPGRPRRVDGGIRDRGAAPHPDRVLRPPVLHLHRPRRPARGVGRRTGRRGPRDVGVGLPAPRRAVPATRWRASSPSPRSTGSRATTSRRCCGRRRCGATAGTRREAARRRNARAGRACARRGRRRDTTR